MATLHRYKRATLLKYKKGAKTSNSGVERNVIRYSMVDELIWPAAEDEISHTDNEVLTPYYRRVTWPWFIALCTRPYRVTRGHVRSLETLTCSVSFVASDNNSRSGGGSCACGVVQCIFSVVLSRVCALSRFSSQWCDRFNHSGLARLRLNIGK